MEWRDPDPDLRVASGQDLKAKRPAFRCRPLSSADRRALALA
jgi:hypothetical protein